MNQFTNKILMIKPNKFRSNELTETDNVFQVNKTVDEMVSKEVIYEFENLKNTLISNGIKVFSFDDDSEFDTPDAVFPNNWISFHPVNQIILYPMFAKNRRFERKSGIIEKLIDSGINIEIKHDYSSYENNNVFLEGTGSIVLDRKNKLAYCSISNRSNNDLFLRFCNDMHFKPIVFSSIHENLPIYHTNVMMSMCKNFVVICLESISNIDDKRILIQTFNNLEIEIIDISIKQMLSFLGNCIQLKDENDRPILVMSSKAFNSINKNQLDKIEKHTKIIHSNIDRIETLGGGSARCMIAEIF